MIKYYGKIIYQIDRTHPDYKCYMGDPEQPMEFFDIYEFNDNTPFANCEAYIKRDLALVAGGGYSAEHIKNVRYEIMRMF